MSRQPSPGPSQPMPIGQVMHGIPPQTRQKSKTFAPGITAGAEDVKYQTKYKELKRKVREIEGDNDKLQFKVLQAKKSINRMKIERAVLYDRLSQVPPSPELNDRQPLPPIHSGPGIPPHQTSHLGASANHHHREAREHAAMDPNDRSLMEYMHTHPNVRLAVGPDGRPVPVQDTPMGPGVAPSSHALTSAHSSRHAHEPSRQLAPLSHLTPVQHLEPPRSHVHPHSPHLASLPSGSHPHTHTRTRSHSSSSRPQQYSHPAEGLSPLQHIRSPSMQGEREISRRHEERIPHGDPNSHSRHPISTPPSHSPRASTRIHHSQRMDHHPMSHSELERQRERDLEAEREWEYEQRAIAREREIAAHSHRPPTPPFGYRSSRQPADRHPDYHEPPSYRLREEAYHREVSGPGGHTRLARSGTPGSGSGSGGADGPPHPDPRSQFYERDRTRTYASRPPGHEDDYGRDERSAHPRDRSSAGFGPTDRLYSETRKRNYQEMEVDGDTADVPSVTGAARKRLHRDNAPARDVDSEEDEEDLDA